MHRCGGILRSGALLVLRRRLLRLAVQLALRRGAIVGLRRRGAGEQRLGFGTHTFARRHQVDDACGNGHRGQGRYHRHRDHAALHTLAAQMLGAAAQHARLAAFAQVADAAGGGCGRCRVVGCGGNADAATAPDAGTRPSRVSQRSRPRLPASRGSRLRPRRRPPPSSGFSSRSLSAEARRNCLYTCDATVDTTEPTATPMTEPAMPIFDDSSIDVTAANAHRPPPAARTSPRAAHPAPCA